MPRTRRELLSVRQRVEEQIRGWGILVQDTLETRSSILVFGLRRNNPVVLKAPRQQGDEWRCGEVLNAFGGNGTVRVYECHHYNVLLDSDRGWLAIDPKGVLGEVEYEIGASLRNPSERPDMTLHDNP